MKTSKTQVVRMPDQGTTTSDLGRRLRVIAAHRAEEILAEVAPMMRRLRTLLLVVTISIPVSIVAFVVVLWHLAH